MFVPLVGLLLDFICFERWDVFLFVCLGFLRGSPNKRVFRPFPGQAARGSVKRRWQEHAAAAKTAAAAKMKWHASASAATLSVFSFMG